MSILRRAVGRAWEAWIRSAPLVFGRGRDDAPRCHQPSQKRHEAFVALCGPLACACPGSGRNLTGSPLPNFGSPCRPCTRRPAPMHPGRGNRSRHRLHCRARQGVRGGAARPHACPVAAKASTKGHPCARASPDCQPEPAIARGSPLQGCAMGCTNAGHAEPRTQAHPPGWAANRRGESQMPEKKRTRA